MFTRLLRRGRRLRAACATATLCLLPQVALAQPPRSPKPVRITFRVLGEDGQPVLDVKPSDVTLKVDGKVRQLTAVNLVQVSGAERPSSPKVKLPAPYATNSAARGARTLELVIDDDSIAPGHEVPIRDALRRLIPELSSGDRVGIVTPQGRINLAPTDDTDVITRVSGNVVGQAHQTETDSDVACRTLQLLKSLEAVLKSASASPTTIVVFSGGLTGPSAAAAKIGSDSGACPVRTEHFQSLGNAAAAAPAELYLFYLTEGGSVVSSDQAAGFESVAGVTGADYTRITGTVQAAVGRVLRETSAYYEALFQPDESERTGQTYRVDLKVARGQVKVRTRPAIAIPKTLPPATNVAAPKDMLRVRTAFTDLPLRALAYPAADPGQNDVKIVALFEPLEPGATVVAASVGLFDDKSTLKKQWSAQTADLVKRPLMAALTAPPGVYRMRVALVDSTGRAGTADYDLHADVPRADPLQLSALVLGVQQGKSFAPRMEFTDDAAAIGLLEIYRVPKNATLTVNLDVIAGPDEPPLASAPTIVSTLHTEDARIAFGGFDISSLPPGDYLMRATVLLDGKVVGQVARTMRKIVK
jgi:hypothetical protein